MTHVASIIISGERESYEVAAYVRDNRPKGTQERLEKFDLSDLDEIAEDAELHDMQELLLWADESVEGAVDAAVEFMESRNWEKLFRPIMWWELALDEAVAVS